ncbi:MAG TPA: alkyl sulfatase dimerization domain-containing protein [Phenylobacterium sp.]|jgi:alkyl sulfatase BDS1-like metallo-beta-lactamase superfamily hydrolase|uniref:alkyl/aryl-sulfatase n=1 Tax=Phenylobacterium sp. TaxID=1871053 RepID=UPI002D35A432|nr:alkyl sulfatase dimerization domain-containing protein [Phenylobacterium sp.]HZZ67569.1 alkyl sulfatase dimerization domain-containing protein [Phenylobacterium sp.]
MDQRKDATEATRAAQARLAASLPSETGEDMANATRGFLGTIPDADVPGAWSQKPFAFLNGERPDTVNPGLWRQGRLNLQHGLFEVTKGVYQVRGFDLSNITFIEGDKGYVVIDPLISAEPAAAALKLMRGHRGEKPVTGVIYTHSHVDHYGGVRGVISQADIEAGMHIVAPEGFLREAVSENVLAGNAMGRRATYMYGATLPKDPKGHVDAGLGKTVSMGSVSLVPPTISIRETGERLTLDGVDIVFQVTPDTEAPAEMNFFFPQFGALCMAENCTCQLHNLYTPRGAQVRDARAWSHYIDEASAMFAGDTDVLFASHHWPRWGSGEAARFLRQQRDLYKYIHDQTLRLANHGLTPTEIAEQIALPPSLAAEWHTRGYYGTLNHNAKAVYQRYLGWFDGNPANLHRLPPVEAGQRYVEVAGGADALLAKARDAYGRGEYRWVAELVNHLVFAQPSNTDARALQADALEQMGYQAESGPWRAFYLTGAQELRNPRPASETPRQGAAGQLRALPADALLDSFSVRLNGEKAGAVGDLALTLAFSDTGERFAVSVENAVLHHRAGEGGPAATLTRPVLIGLVIGETTLEKALADGAVSGEGAVVLGQLLPLLDRFDFWFEIVAP